VDFLKSFELHLWWRALFAVGVAVTIAAVAAKERDTIILGAGVATFALGEWINRPQAGEMLPGMILKTWYVRRPCISGTVLNAAGLGLIAYGAFRLLFW
jgi:hypothetical protein